MDGVAKLPQSLQAKILALLSAPGHTAAAAKNSELVTYDERLSAVQDDGVAILDDFLEASLAEAVYQRICLQKLKSGSLRKARVGTGAAKLEDESARNDLIEFIQLPDESLANPTDALQSLAKHLERLTLEINASFGFERRLLTSKRSVQLSYYSNGAKYVKHRDSSLWMPGRMVTAIIYFTKTWDESHGGQLRIYNGDKNTIEIEPVFNRLIVFKSHLEHEVLETFCDRFAITMWLYSDQKYVMDRVFKSPTSKLIFVSIASYRDPDTNETVHSLISNAKYPKQIHVYILYQDDIVADANLHDRRPLTPYSNVHQRKVSRLDAGGPYAARREIAQQMSGQKFDYYLQLDSHMRFVRHWDAILIDLLAKGEQLCEKPIISFYPPGFSDENVRNDGSFTVPPGPYNPILMTANPVPDEDGMIRVKGTLQVPAPPVVPWDDGVSESPYLIRQRFLAAGFLFSRSLLIHDMYNLTEKESLHSQLRGLFFGEEALVTAKVWTRGYEVFGPRDQNLPIVFHRWNRNYRRTLWNDVVDELHCCSVYRKLQDERKESQSFVKAVLGLFDADSKITVECSPDWIPGSVDGLGLDRSLGAWKAFVGLASL